MGPGHLAVGLAAKPLTPKVPLWVLLVASEALDLLSIGFIAVGIEQVSETTTDFQQGIKVLTPGSIPWSHGLFMSVVWSLVATVIIFLIYKERRAGIIVGLVVFSHWLLDLVVHLPDLPLLFEGSPVVGLGLWSTGPGLLIAVLLEIVLLVAGFLIYWRTRKQPVPDNPQATA